jgi:hypothetical protein
MPSNRCSRRRALAVAGAAGLSALAGCSNRLGLGSDGDQSATITFRLYDRTATLRDRYVRDLTETRVPWDENALAAAVNGSAFTTQHARPFPTSEPLWAEYDGRYYHLDEVVVGEETVTRPVLRLHDEGRIGEGESGAPEHVDTAALPQTDDRAVQIAYMAARARGDVGGVPWGLVQRGGYVYRNESAVASSELLADDGPAYVAYRDRVWRVEVERETFHEAVYRPVAEPVAETEAEIETVLRGRLVGARIDPASLSAAERDVFRRARSGDGYGAEHPFPDAFVSVLKRLDERAYVDGNVTKDAGADEYPPRDLIRYGDAYFDYRLRLTEADDR